ncbi:unnamed protein product, partial [Phyllotreta striolata]
MNKLAFFTVLLCASALVCAKPKKEEDVTSEEAVMEIKKMAQSIRAKYNTTILLDLLKLADKVNEKCPHLEDKLDSVGEKVSACIENIELGSKTICTLVKENFMQCFKPVRDVMVSCMPEESKDLPVMVGKVIVALVNTACQSTVEEVLELFNPCQMQAMHHENFSKTPACKQVKTAIVQHKNKLPSNSLICEILPKMHTCEEAVMQQVCKNSVTRNIVTKFHNAVENSLKTECDA